jgi:hypothetical protein
MDSSTLDRLERLAKLRTDGALSDSEYLAAKAAVLSDLPPITDQRPEGEAVKAESQSNVPGQLSENWRKRFGFVDQYGLPNSQTYSAAIALLPFWERARMVMSPLGFFFGPFYFVYLGLWKPAITLIGVSLIYALLLDAIEVPPWFDRASYVLPAVAYGWTCIPLYYLKVRRGVHSWNPMVWWSPVSAPAAQPAK